MITSKVAANQAFAQVNRLNKGDDASKQNRGHDDVIRTPNGEAVDGIKTEISTFSAHPLQQFNAEFNAVVKSIRIADQAMGEIETNVEQMESEVEMFMKQYPPYPPGSEDRIKYLSRFAMLRKQIDQLTFPPDAGARNIIGRSQDGQSGALEIEIGGKRIGSAIHRQPVHTGREGLAIPEISVDATDDQIAGLKEALGSARKLVNQRRRALSDNAIQIIQSVE